MGFLVALVFLLAIPNNFLTLDNTSLSLVIIHIVIGLIAISVFVATALTDLKKGLIPDRITYPAVIITLVILIASSIYKIVLIYLSLVNNPIGKYLLPPYSDYFLRHALAAASPLTSGLIAAIAAFLFFGGLIFVTKGKGMGGGDLKLGIFMGLILGVANFITALMIAFISGSIVGIVLLILRKKHFGQTIPFGPFLSLGGVIAILYGDVILNTYLNLRLP